MWLDSHVECAGIHNFTSHIFTPAEKQVLANGLRFTCTPPKSHLATYAQQFLTDNDRGWLRFTRSLSNRLLRQQEDQQPYLAKFRVASRQSHFIDRLEESQRLTSTGVELQLLDQYRALTLPLLRRAVNDQHHHALVQRQPPNLSRVEHEFIQRLVHDPLIAIKPADKNLGLVLIDSSWYQSELKRMLSDRTTYAIFTGSTSRTVTRGRPISDKVHEDQLIKRLMTQLQSLVKRHESSLRAWSPVYADQALKFVTSSLSVSAVKIPTIYLLVKVHKPRLSGRPIVPCTSWITTPASVLVDHLLQEVLRKAAIPWIVKDTKSLIVQLEGTRLPPAHRDGVFVTADIASLYTNIDTEMGLRLVDQFLCEQSVDRDHARVIMDLLAFVMRNSYLQFNGTVYQQIDGTAMGTATAPSYANIVVYMLERPLVVELATNGVLFLYLRFLDDVFLFLAPDCSDDAKFRLNQLHPKLRFEFVTHPIEAAFLDLMVHKGRRFKESGVFDLRVHQKKMNLYLYITWHSFHTPALKRSFIQTELMRYIRNSSDHAEYTQLKRVFWQRLRDRGYPVPFLMELFNSIWYQDRDFFLWPSAELLRHPDLVSRRRLPRSACLLNRIKRADDGLVAAAGSGPTVFVIPFTPLSAVVPTRSILCRFWNLLQTGATPIPRPIIAYQSHPSLMSTLVFFKAKVMEELRTQQLQRRTVQTKLSFQPLALTPAARTGSSQTQGNARL